MRNRFKRVATNSVAMVALAVAAFPAAAQVAVDADPAGDREVRLGEVTVTAQRREESLQDVPVSVGVVDGVEMAKQNISSLQELSTRQASMVVRETPGGDQIAIRGTASGFNAGFEQSVASFVDGIYRPRARSSRIAIFDIERVEVLRGPQSTFFGANAIAGALNITTRKPGTDFGINGTGFYSPDENEYNVELGLDAPLSDAVGLRFAGRVSGVDSPTVLTRTNQRGEDTNEQFRISGRAEVTETFTLEARYDYALNENSGGTALEIVDCPPADVAPAGFCALSLAQLGDFDDRLDGRSGAGYMDSTDVELQEFALTGTLELGWADLVFTTGFQDQTAELDLEQANFPVLSPLGVAAILPAVVNEDFEQFSQEVRLQSTGDGPFSYMVGAYYEDSDLAVNSAIGFFQAGVGAFAAPELSAADLVVQAADATQNSETWSGFASVSYDVTEDLTVTGGLRYSDVTKTAIRDGFFGTIQPFPAGTQPRLLDLTRVSPTADAALGARLGGTAPFNTAELSEDEWMPSANITYQLADDATLYASYAHGFKAGGYNLSRSSDIFEPETADAYEVGLKSTWFNRRLITNLALFWTDYYDLQEAGVIYSPTGTPLSFIGNVASSRARGVELESSFAATADLTFDASLSYLESQYVDYADAPCSPYQTALGTCSATTPGDLSGHTRSNAPKWSGRVAMNYERPVTENWNFEFSPSVYFRTKYYLQTLPEELTSQDGFVKVDLRAALTEADGNRTVALIVQNLFDEETYSFAGHAPTGPGSTQKIIDRGRVVGLQLSFNY